MNSKRFENWAWAFTAYVVAVILFGAWVRISHSGAGCGAHWPLCDGEILPSAASTEKLIEFTHRITSGLCGVFSIILVVWAWRGFGRKAAPTRAAIMTLIFILFEGVIGAGLVLAELVDNNQSMARAVVIAVHLTNTLFLTACAALTAASAKAPARPFGLKSADALLHAMAAGFVVVAMTGAITALGDTLFPVQPDAHGSLLGQISAELSAGQHFLVRLRIVHPVLAAGLGLFMLWGFDHLRDSHEGAGPKWGLILTVTQLGIGLLNVALAAPSWMQLSHLALAQGLWIALVYTAYTGQASRV
jgi:heme A synthase